MDQSKHFYPPQIYDVIVHKPAMRKQTVIDLLASYLEIQRILYAPEDDRTTISILRLNAQIFIHHSLLKELNAEEKCGKIYGNYYRYNKTSYNLKKFDNLIDMYIHR